MVEAFSKRPANVRDGRSVLQKTCQCEGWQKRSPEDSGCEGPADTLLILMPMTTYLTYLLTLSLIFAIHDYLSYLLTYLKLDICNMAHETNKATSDQSNTPRPAGGKGNQGSMTFFIDTFSFLVIRSKCFYSRSSSPNSYMRST